MAEIPMGDPERKGRNLQPPSNTVLGLPTALRWTYISAPSGPEGATTGSDGAGDTT